MRVRVVRHDKYSDEIRAQAARGRPILAHTRTRAQRSSASAARAARALRLTTSRVSVVFVVILRNRLPPPPRALNSGAAPRATQRPAPCAHDAGPLPLRAPDAPCRRQAGVSAATLLERPHGVGGGAGRHREARGGAEGAAESAQGWRQGAGREADTRRPRGGGRDRISSRHASRSARTRRTSCGGRPTVTGATSARASRGASARPRQPARGATVPSTGRARRRARRVGRAGPGLAGPPRSGGRRACRRSRCAVQSSS